MSRPGLLIARHQFSADRRKINPVPGRGICAHRSHPSTAADRRHGLQRVLRATVAESRPPREHSATTPLLQLSSLHDPTLVRRVGSSSVIPRCITNRWRGMPCKVFSAGRLQVCLLFVCRVTLLHVYGGYRWLETLSQIFALGADYPRKRRRLDFLSGLVPPSPRLQQLHNTAVEIVVRIRPLKKYTTNDIPKYHTIERFDRANIGRIEPSPMICYSMNESETNR